jgi:hypothetical protein
MTWLTTSRRTHLSSWPCRLPMHSQPLVCSLMVSVSCELGQPQFSFGTWAKAIFIYSLNVVCFVKDATVRTCRNSLGSICLLELFMRRINSTAVGAQHMALSLTLRNLVG